MQEQRGWETPAVGRRGLWMVPLLLAAVVAVAALVRIDPSPEPSGLPVEERTDPPPEEPAIQAGAQAQGSWASAPPSPVAWEAPPDVVWTGREVLLWGATEDGSAGAAYEPASRTWRRLPDGPLSARVSPVAVFAGDDHDSGELLIWGGRPLQSGTGSWLIDGAAYDPSTDRWRPLRPSPLSGRVAAEALWTGEEVLVLGGVGPDGYMADGAAYDPETERWTAVPAAAAGITAATWTGREAVVVTDDGVLAAWRPGGERWRALPTVPQPVGPGPALSSTAGRVILWPGEAAEAEAGRLWMLRLSSERWTRGPPAPLAIRSGPMVHGSGDEVLVMGGGSPVLAAGALYSVRSETWSPLPAAPLPAMDGLAATWTGHWLFVAAGAGYRDLAVWAPADVPPPLTARTGALVHLSTDRTLLTIDVDRRTSMPRRDLPLAPGDPPHRLAAVGDRLVFYGGDTYAVTPDGGQPTRLGASDFFLSAGPEAVWLVRTRHAHVGEITKVTADGGVLVDERALPSHGWASGGLADALVVTRGTGWQLYAPETRAVIAEGEEQLPFATGERTVALCASGHDGPCDRLGFLTASGSTLDQVAAPAGWTFDLGTGAFSADDARFAVPVVHRSGDVGLAVVEAATGEITLADVPIRRPPRVLAWHPRRPWVFTAGEGRLLAIRSGDVLAHDAGMAIGEEYYGLAVTAAPSDDE